MFKYNFDAFAYSYHAEGCDVLPDDAVQNFRLLLLQNSIAGNTMEIFGSDQVGKLRLKKASVKCENENEAALVAAALNSVVTDAKTVRQHIQVTPKVAALLKDNFPYEYLTIVGSTASDFINRPRGRAN